MTDSEIRHILNKMIERFDNDWPDNLRFSERTALKQVVRDLKDAKPYTTYDAELHPY